MIYQGFTFAQYFIWIMVADETLLDGVGALAVGFALVLGLSALQQGSAPLAILRTTSPVILGGLAAIAGAGALVTFLKNR
jgi:hypothetical protein